MRSYPRNSPKAAARADPHLVDAETVGLEAARHHWQMATRRTPPYRLAVMRPDPLSRRMRRPTESWCSRDEAVAP